MKMKVILNFQRNKEILFERKEKMNKIKKSVKKKARKNEIKNNQLKNLKELSFANSISFVLFQTTLLESVFILQTLSFGIIHSAMAS